MELRALRLINFRGYRNIEITFTKGLQMLVGKNDIGKSTIFEALDIFFNEKDAAVKISLDDFNVNAKKNGEEKCSITCKFELTDRDNICVETVVINPVKEYLVNQAGQLEVTKEWDIKNFKPVGYLSCYIPECIPSDLLTAKITDLKKKIKEYHLEDKVNQTSNSSMRHAIYEYLIENNPQYNKTTHKVPTKNIFGEKDILDNISRSFPDYYLFKADRKNSTSDEEIQNPMNIAVKRAFETPEVICKITEIEDIVLKQLNDINNATIQKLTELDVDYGNLLKARVTANWSSAIKNDILDGNEVPINKRGSGIRRLLLLSYLLVEAEKKSFERSKKDIIYAIEEPETALHPYMQKKFIQNLIKMAQDNRCDFGDEMASNAKDLNRYQVLMTTHLPNYVAYANLDQIIYLYRNDNGQPQIHAQDEGLKRFIQDEMGKIPIIDYKFIVFVEGENDVDALKNYGKISDLKNIFDIFRNDIQIIPLKGSNLKKCIELDYYWNLPIKQYHLYDSDVIEYKTDIIDIKCNTEQNKLVRGRITALKEMENYIPISMIERKIGLDLSDYYSKWHTNAFSITVTLLAQNDTSNSQFVGIKNMKSDFSKKEKVLKAYLNKTILKGVTRKELEEHGVYEEIETWFKEMKELYEYKKM